MNVATEVENKRINKILLRVLPQNTFSSILFWAFLSTFLFILTIAVAYLQPTVFTQKFPFLALLTVASCIRFRTKGLIGSYIAITLFLLLFFKGLTLDERLWQMGILFTLALNLFILLLSVEEIEASLNQLYQHSNETSSQLHKTELNFQKASKSWEEEQKEFEIEIERLKNEAEQRRVERIKDKELIELVQSEIEMLNSQKEEILNEARQIRQEALEKEPVIIKEPTSPQETVELQEAILILQHKQALPQPTPICIKEENPEQIKQLQDAHAQAEGLYSQLRLQFEEKSNVLSQTRKELFQTQTKLQSLQLEQKLAEIEPDREESAQLEASINTLVQQTEQLEQEIEILEEVVSQLLSVQA